MTNEPRKIDLSDELGTDRRDDLKKMPNDMPSWMASTIIKIDKFSKQVGNIVCWI